eukprot:363353-Chlamydomonas_euryale.AAC.20
MCGALWERVYVNALMHLVLFVHEWEEACMEVLHETGTCVGLAHAHVVSHAHVLPQAYTVMGADALVKLTRVRARM